jgi:hypothetical protein
MRVSWKIRASFHRLVTETSSSFPEYIKARDDCRQDLYRQCIKNFFRRSSRYLNMFGQDNFGIGGLFQLYEEAFQKEIFEVIHLVPLLGLGFHEPYLDFLKFQVRLFTSDHLNKVLDNDVNTIFTRTVLSIRAS